MSCAQASSPSVNCDAFGILTPFDYCFVSVRAKDKFPACHGSPDKVRARGFLPSTRRFTHLPPVSPRTGPNLLFNFYMSSGRRKSHCTRLRRHILCLGKSNTNRRHFLRWKTVGNHRQLVLGFSSNPISVVPESPLGGCDLHQSGGFGGTQ